MGYELCILWKRPFNVFVLQDRYESIIICFVIPSISDNFKNNKKKKFAYAQFRSRLKSIWFYVKVCIWQILGSFNIIYNMQDFYLVLFGLQEKKVIVYLQKIEWLAYIIVQFISQVQWVSLKTMEYNLQFLIKYVH